MPNVIPDFPIAEVAVADNDFSIVLLAASERRNILGIFNESGVEIFVAYTNTQPVATTTMHKILDTEVWFWENIVPKSKVYVFQNSGGSVNVKVGEGL